MVMKRIRGRRWMSIKAAFLSARPLCVMCLAKGHVATATELDHIVALMHGGTKQDKTAKDEGHLVRVGILVGRDRGF